MFCPNCGTRNSSEQKFCRSCGLNLEKSIESLLEQLPTAESANLLKQTKLLEKYGNFAFGGFATVLLLGISILVFTIFNKMVLSGENVIFGLLLLSFIIFAVLTLTYVFLNESLKEKKAKAKPVFNRELEKKNTAKLLEDKPFEIVPTSVTEGTTDLFYVEKRKITDELS
ncbi:MAG TPA: zinc ribbon domain-containing protein [Pyrinomonadaceae bacterium]|jgi:hypothetical protein